MSVFRYLHCLLIKEGNQVIYFVSQPLPCRCIRKDGLPLFTQADDGISNLIDFLLVVTGAEQLCLPLLSSILSFSYRLSLRIYSAKSIHNQASCHHRQNHDGNVIHEKENSRLTEIKKRKCGPPGHISGKATLYKRRAPISGYATHERTYRHKYFPVFPMQLSEGSNQMCPRMYTEQYISPVRQKHMDASRPR